MDAIIEQKQELLEEMRTRAERTTVAFNGMPKAAANPHARENSIVCAADLSTEIEEDILQLFDIQHDIENAIATIQDSKLQSLLELRYLVFLPWKKIADTLGCSMTSIIRLHSKALHLVVVPEKYKDIE